MPIDASLERGIALYAAGRFWDAHEAWEDEWRREHDADRKRLLQALIQLAAALHKLTVMRDRASALRILSRAREKLDGLREREDAMGLRLVELRQGAARLADAIDALAPGAALDASQVPALVYGVGATK